MKWTDIEANKHLSLGDKCSRADVLTALGGVLKYAETHRLLVDEDAEAAIHEWRKSIRRARALMRMVEPALGRRTRRRLDRQLRALVRATSSLRDGDVLRGTAEALLPPGTLPDDAHDALYQALDDTRAAQTGPSSPEGVLRGLAGAAKRVFECVHKELPRVTKRDVRRGVEATYKSAREALRETRRAGDDDTVHTWRKRVKELRYQLEALPGDRANRLEKDFGRLAEELGRVTDQMVLIGFVGSEIEDTNDVVRHHVRDRVAEGIEACARRHAILFIPRASTFAKEVLP
ncbi:MAG: CHAD domain-containing protein [Myxococcota bacterium]